MRQNILFNFLETVYLKPERKRRDLALTRDTDRYQTPYFRLALDNAHPITFDHKAGCYTLSEHHVSVYQDDTQHGQYHYSAYFKDTQNTQYQLHVYFNETDEFLPHGALRFSKQKADAIYEAIALSDAQTERFMHLAKTQCPAILSKLRTQFNDKVTKLQEYYNNLEIEASTLSEAMADDPKPYSDKLNEMQKTLASLILLSKESKQYVGMQKLLQRIQDHLIQLYHSASAAAAPRPMLQHIEPTGAGSAALEEGVSLEMVAAEAKAPIDLSEEITLLLAKFTSLPKIKTFEYATQLSELFTETSALAIQLESNECFASLDALQTLQKLHYNIRQLGEKTLKKALQQEHIRIAEALIAFCYKLSEQDLVYPLTACQENILDFILAHKQITLNNQPIHIRGQEYASAMHYCVAAGAPALACFSVLLKHHASVLVTHEDGLPLAYKILTSQHPFRPALMKDPVFRSTTFFKQLIVALRHYLQHHQPAPAIRGRIEADIAHYGIQLECLKKTPQPLFISPKETLPSIKLKILDKLQQDADIVAAMTEVAELPQKRPNSRRQRLTQQTVLAQLKDIVMALDDQDMDMEGDTYQELKANTLKQLKVMKEVLPAREQLTEVQSQLKNPSLGKKRLRELRQEEKKLIETLKQHSSTDNMSLREIRNSVVSSNARKQLSSGLNSMKMALEMIGGVLRQTQNTVEAIQSAAQNLSDDASYTRLIGLLDTSIEEHKMLASFGHAVALNDDDDDENEKTSTPKIELIDSPELNESEEAAASATPSMKR